MRIIINYESSWRNSFLTGTNDKPITKKNDRKFKGSLKQLNDDENNYEVCNITKNTVMGILNRLIGDQRKLYQSQKDPNNYFYEIENLLTEQDIKDYAQVTEELVFIRNLKGSNDQHSFTGMIKADDPAFTSDFSNMLWGLLFLDKSEVIDFILDDSYKVCVKLKQLDPLIVMEQIEYLTKAKTLELDEKLNEILKILEKKFPDDNFLKDQKFLTITLYTAALYLQLDRLKTQFNLAPVLTKKGGLHGIAKTGSFTKKNFMDRFTTGSKKIIWGNPYISKKSVKGSMLLKASGRLEINLNISPDQAKDLQQKIENAGVSTFYIGKKGIAYVVDIK